MESSLRLFKAVLVNNHDGKPDAFAALAAQTVKNGFIFAPEVATEYAHTQLVQQVDKLFGRNAAQLNNSFHKSFAKVRDASILQLWVEQSLHYLTTYGFEHLGIFSNDTIYVPKEALDLPDIDGIRLVVIRGLTHREMKAELLKLLATGIALSQQSVTDCVDVAQVLTLTQDEVESVKNREVKAALYDHFGMVPSDPVEFLRFVVYRATEKTLLIKNAELISALKTRNNNDLVRYFQAYDAAKLATIFNRYKPIFLALRTNPALKKKINQVRRLAVANHKPMPEDYLNSITARLTRNEGIDIRDLSANLQAANVFRKIRLAYALKFRTTNPDSILYRVRNGKSFAKAFSFTNNNVEHIYQYVLASIVNDVRPNVAGKTVYIPKGLTYALPATEKQFTGNLPTGTCVEVTDDLIAGVHWLDVDGSTIDLDLSIANLGGKIGWDARYRTGQALYSGDLTAAPPPHGASEVFRITGPGSWLMSVNYYNYRDNVDVPFKIIAGSDSAKMITANRVIDPKSVVAFSNSVMDVQQKTLGLIVADHESKRFYFTEADFMKSRSARHTTAAEHTRRYLYSYYENTINLNDVLIAAGAILIDTPEQADIDLSPEAVDKTTIINLLTAA
ncbi:hypothetical protein FHT44_004919 [Mycolicibacterium sp. BK634]|uniref:hypothetical protein n=1 Tax=Mycolicibacterium sp. BK634 TaxID=2587099 RepID=UPI00161F3C4D|nr:hypothetical protein [Mycolicibacterium sp. BK634]MBB3752407.1 hypothetical protein [Mycolicibacterium sp. BK634]